MFVNKSLLIIVCVKGGFIDHNISVIFRYFLHFSCAFDCSLRSRQSCPVAGPLGNVNTAATEC